MEERASLVDQAGLEPATFALWVRYSDRLSYWSGYQSNT